MRIIVLIFVFFVGCTKKSNDKNYCLSNLKEYHLPMETILHFKRVFGNKLHPKYCIIISNSDENRYTFTFYEKKINNTFFYNKFLLIQNDTIKMVHYEDLVFSSKNKNVNQFDRLLNSMTFVLNLKGDVLETLVIK